MQHQASGTGLLGTGPTARLASRYIRSEQRGTQGILLEGLQQGGGQGKGWGGGSQWRAVRACGGLGLGRAIRAHGRAEKVTEMEQHLDPGRPAPMQGCIRLAGRGL